MNFKDILKADIQNTFLNDSEFADTHIINGIEMKAVIDDDSLESEITVKFHGQQARQQTRLHRAEKTLHISSEYFAKPLPGKLLVLDGKNYVVLSASEKDGMYEIDIQKAGGS